MSENNYDLFEVLNLSKDEEEFAKVKIYEITNNLFLSRKGAKLDNKIIQDYNQKLCNTFKDREARKGLLAVCRLLKELEDNEILTEDIFGSLNGINIDEFLTFTKSFRLKTDEFFCVSSDREIVDPNKTKPALVIANVDGTYDSKESRIFKFRDNTCKVGYACQEQWVCLLNGKNFGEKLRKAEHNLRREQWKAAISKQGYSESNIKNKIESDFRGHQNALGGLGNIKAHFLARRLFRKEKAKVFNIAFCGRKDSDEVDVDEDQYNIFYMLNDCWPVHQQLKLFGNGNVKCFLFDQIRNGSQLNKLGLRITERVLKLFLPEDQYAVNLNNSYADNNAQKVISVTKKNCKYSEAANVFSQHKPVDSVYNHLTSPEYDKLDQLLRILCTNHFSQGLPEGVDDFKTKLNSIDINDIIKHINEMGMKLEKNDFVDMLSSILYVRDEDIHAEFRNLKQNRSAFVGVPLSWEDLTLGPLDVIRDFIPKWLKKKSINPIENLPSAFVAYTSNDDKTVFSPIHYIQALFASPLIVKKYHEADAQTKAKIIWNIDYLRDALVNPNENGYNVLVAQLNCCMKKYNMNPQEVFAAMICNGTAFTTKLNNDKIPKGEKDDITSICEVAYNLTEYDLDNDMREHVTQLNFVELVKNKEGKTTEGKVTGGFLVVPMNAKRLFSEYEYNVSDDTEWEWNYEENDIENNKNLEGSENNNINNSNQNENNNQGQKNVSIEEQIVRRWMAQAGVQDDEEIEKILKEYIRKEKIDSVNNALNLDFVPSAIQACQNKLESLRDLLEPNDSNKNVGEKTQLDSDDSNNQELQININNNFNNNGLGEHRVENTDNNGIYNNLNNGNEDNNFFNQFSQDRNIQQDDNNSNNNDAERNINNGFSQEQSADIFDGFEDVSSNSEYNNRQEETRNTNDDDKEFNDQGEVEVAANYEGIYYDIKKSDHFCWNMCVLRNKDPKTYKEVAKSFGPVESIKVVLYRIFTFFLTKDEFEGYNYNKQKYVPKKEGAMISKELLNPVKENNKNEGQNIPSQEREAEKNRQSDIN